MDCPFEIVSVSDIEKDLKYDPKWLTGILSPTSRKKKRDLDCCEKFKISLFSKLEQGILSIYIVHVYIFSKIFIIY